MNQIRLDWGQIHQVYSAALLSILDKYSSVFSDELGTLKDKIYADPNAPPRFHSFAFTLRDLVEK